MKTADQILTEARELIRAGWTQGDYTSIEDGKVCYCAVGAVRKAAGLLGGGELFDNPSYDGAINRLHRVVGGSIPYWNDVYGRTREEVVEAFDRAIAGGGQ